MGGVREFFFFPLVSFMSVRFYFRIFTHLTSDYVALTEQKKHLNANVSFHQDGVRCRFQIQTDTQ